MISIKYAWKRLKNICMKIKYLVHQCKGFLDPNLYPNHSIHKPNANPSAGDLQAAPENKNKVGVLCQKVYN